MWYRNLEADAMIICGDYIIRYTVYRVTMREYRDKAWLVWC